MSDRVQQKAVILRAPPMSLSAAEADIQLRQPTDAYPERDLSC